MFSDVSKKSIYSSSLKTPSLQIVKAKEDSLILDLRVIEIKAVKIKK